jgi:CO/xanthine dehydrogenase Mo-binding subunit
MPRKVESQRRGAVGRGLPRVDGVAKVCGTARYPQDLLLPDDCLHVATVRAPCARARIRSVDFQKALSVSGVVRVLTAADVGGTNRFGLLEADQPVLAEDVVRGASDVIALVVAGTERAAREGARRVALDLKRETPLTDPELACAPGAPLVHAERRRSGRHRNVVAEREIRRGDLSKAFARAAVVVSGEYRTGFVEHAFLAPEAGVAERDSEGRLTLYVATQWPEQDLRQAAIALGEPLENLRIVQQTIGGAFGGREDISLQIFLLLAARETDRPVRMVWDRKESIRGHGKRHPFRIRHRLAADSEGRFLAADIDVLVDAGCYASTSAAVIDNALSQACGPYAVPSVLVKGRAVYTNNPYTCAFRGFGVNQVTFAMEQQVNKLAFELGLDPGLVRRRNFVEAGGRLATGTKVSACEGLPKTLRAAETRARRRKLPRTKGDWVRGRGIASASKNVGYGLGVADRATAEVTISRDGAIIRIGAAEVGQGIETTLTQIAAETLGVAPGRVSILWRDTSSDPEAGSTSASRQTFVSGNAVQRACELARRAVAKKGGIAKLTEKGLSRRFTFRAPRTRPLGVRGAAQHAYAYAWSTSAADVRVDLATGRVEVERIVTALDAGRVVNPRLLEGQVEGGAVMGQGYALQEQCIVRDGMPASPCFESCGVPTAVDAAPEIETVVVESAEPLGPFGARGIGEITMIPVVPAITAAIHAATGAWIDEIPATPDRVLAAIARLRESPSTPARHRPRRRR